MNDPTGIVTDRRLLRGDPRLEPVDADTVVQYGRAVACGLSVLMDIRDLHTGIHSTRLAEWVVRMGEQLGLGEAELHDLEIASLLHDVGKVGIPDEVLLKPGRLTEEEMAVVRRHPDLGWAVLRQIPGFERVSLFVLHHHEWVDGRGYPAGLTRRHTPLGARVVSVVDAFDAMISTRPYRKSLPAEEAFRRLRIGRDTQFDRDIVDLFISIAAADLEEVSQIAEPAR